MTEKPATMLMDQWNIKITVTIKQDDDEEQQSRFEDGLYVE